MPPICTRSAEGRIVLTKQHQQLWASQKCGSPQHGSSLNQSSSCSFHQTVISCPTLFHMIKSRRLSIIINHLNITMFEAMEHPVRAWKSLSKWLCELWRLCVTMWWYAHAVDLKNTEHAELHQDAEEKLRYETASSSTTQLQYIWPINWEVVIFVLILKSQLLNDNLLYHKVTWCWQCKEKQKNVFFLMLNY